MFSLLSAAALLKDAHKRQSRRERVRCYSTHTCHPYKLAPLLLIGHLYSVNMIYLIHCKNLCKCYNVFPPSTIAIIKKRKGKPLTAIKIKTQTLAITST
jgi:hypothetical protein